MYCKGGHIIDVLEGICQLEVAQDIPPQGDRLLTLSRTRYIQAKIVSKNNVVKPGLSS